MFWSIDYVYQGIGICDRYDKDSASINYNNGREGSERWDRCINRIFIPTQQRLLYTHTPTSSSVANAMVVSSDKLPVESVGRGKKGRRRGRVGVTVVITVVR